MEAALLAVRRAGGFAVREIGSETCRAVCCAARDASLATVLDRRRQAGSQAEPRLQALTLSHRRYSVPYDAGEGRRPEFEGPSVNTHAADLGPALYRTVRDGAPTLKRVGSCVCPHSLVSPKVRNGNNIHV